MNTYQIEIDGSSLRLHLQGEVTIEHARELHAALAAAWQPGRILAVDASAADRLDAAALQVLVAAAGASSEAVLLAASPALGEAFRRYALANPYRSPNP
jgi:anti-anti-sigma regulatory factor